MTRHRVTVFDRPRGPWRETREQAMEDAVGQKLASWDETKREHFLAVPVDITTDWDWPGPSVP
jgi:hypothetical protein